MRQVDITIESWPLSNSFNISRGSKLTAEVIRVDITQDQLTGRGECVPYQHYGESLSSVSAQIDQISSDIQSGSASSDLHSLLPAGAARNAVDCALWDLECKIAGISAWKKAGFKPRPHLLSAFTISLDQPEKMALKAAQAKGFPLLKLKLGADDGLDEDRILRVRRACRDKRLIIDANEGWQSETLEAMLDICEKANIELVEQPLPREKDDILETIPHKIPICADESIHTSEHLSSLRQRYDWVNIKLDKCGGLTSGLDMLENAQKLRFGTMIGCMVGTSLAMAPALLLANHADMADLDGPLWLKQDRNPSLTYKKGKILTKTTDLWGEGRK